MPADPTPDSVAAYLDEVRQRAALTKAAAHGYTPRGETLPGGPAGEWLIANLAAAADVPRLLAALDAVLAKAAEWDQIAAKLDEHADRADQNGGGERAQHLDGRAYGHRDSAKSLREAISRELLREGESR